jgi:hypothetical protein
MTAKRRRHPSYPGYAYPFDSSTTVGRIDQGQDFGGSGPVRAIGRARILKTKSPWPEYSGGAGVLYELLEGPNKGKAVYVYEGIHTTVKRGQIVAAGQKIGSIIPGTSSGIESGWADPTTGQPISAAEYSEGKETKSGKQFAAFLSKLQKPGPNGGYPFPFKSKAEEERIKKIGEEENLGEGVFPSPGDVASEVANGLGSLFASHAEALMLNIGLVGGGAFLVYYGTALMMGVKSPGAKLTAPLKGAMIP